MFTADPKTKFSNFFAHAIFEKLLNKISKRFVQSEFHADLNWKWIFLNFPFFSGKEFAWANNFKIPFLDRLLTLKIIISKIIQNSHFLDFLEISLRSTNKNYPKFLTHNFGVFWSETYSELIDVECTGDEMNIN